jgi:hypothetical protein
MMPRSVVVKLDLERGFGRVMDPYQTLGVPRNCTREQVKEIFRARARLAHPDRGGEVPEFIRLRKAYERVLADLDRNPLPAALEAVPAPRQDSPRKRPRPKRKPEIVWLDERPRADRPIKAPDPSWAPDFVLLDDQPAHNRPPRPPDPHWDPEFVLLDEEPRDRWHAEPHNPRLERPMYDAWVRQFSARSLQRDPGRLSSSSNATWIVMLVILILFLTLILIWALPGDSPQIGNQEEASRYEHVLE